MNKTPCIKSVPRFATKKYFLIYLLSLVILSDANVVLAVDTANTSGKTAVQQSIETYLCAPTEVSKEKNSNETGSFTGMRDRQKEKEIQYNSGLNNTAKYDLYKCINQLYKFAIAISSVIAVFFLVIAGYLYMSSEGNAESVDKAKSILVSSITAMVILFSGYILLRAINPDLITFQNIQPPSVKLQTLTDKDYKPLYDSNGNLVGEGSGGIPKDKIGKTGIDGCNSCVDYTQNGFVGNGTQKPGQNTFLNKDLVEKLKKVKPTYGGFIINEAYPPTIDHGDGCHSNGSCADIGITGATPTEVNKFCKAVKDSGSGLVFLNEYANFQNQAAQMPDCPTPKAYKNTTGGHLHVK